MFNKSTRIAWLITLTIQILGSSAFGQIHAPNASSALDFQIPEQGSLKSGFLTDLFTRKDTIDWISNAEHTLLGGQIPIIPEEYVPLIGKLLEIHSGAIDQAEAAINAAHKDPYIEICTSREVVEVTSKRMPVVWNSNDSFLWHVRLGALFHLQRNEITPAVRYLRLGYRVNEISIVSLFDGSSIHGYIDMQIQLFTLHCAAIRFLKAEDRAQLRFASVLPQEAVFLKIAGIEELHLEAVFARANEATPEELRAFDKGIDRTNRLFEACEAWTEESTCRELSSRLSKLNDSAGGNDAIYNPVFLAVYRRSFNVSRSTCEVLSGIEWKSNSAVVSYAQDVFRKRNITGVSVAVENREDWRELQVTGQALEIPKDSPFLPLPLVHKAPEPPLTWKIRIPAEAVQ